IKSSKNIIKYKINIYINIIF
ncbi:hypothetical protein, partial [Plasmodium yoelii yoelii]